MKTTTRIAGAMFAIFAAVWLSAAGEGAAQQAFSVSLIAPGAPVASGETAIVRVRVEGDITLLPGLQATAEGGEVAGVLAPTPVAADVAEGAIFVTRATPGVARVSVAFAGTVMAETEARFAGAGAIEVLTTLDAGPDAAARTWRYEVVDGSGSVVATLQTSTNGDAPTGSAPADGLAPGRYVVRQVFGNDTGTDCDAGRFYEVVSPAGGSAVIELASTPVAIEFTVRPCAGLPAELAVDIPVDVIAPGPGGGVVGEPAVVLPEETPFSEVAGARREGPGTPIAPATGNATAGRGADDAGWLAIAGLATLGAGLAVSGLSVRARRG